MRTLLMLLFISSLQFVSGQINFFNLYTDNGDDFGEGIVQLEDSSYVITGSSSSFGWGSTDAFLLKIDSLGNYLWSKNYGGPEADGGRRVMYNPGDGFYVAGTTNSYGNGAYDFYLFKTDLSGNLIWERTYGGSGWERLNDAVLTNDGGIIMVGENASNSTDNKNGYIVKTNLSGDTLWTKLIGGDGEDHLNALHYFHDSLVVSVGSIYVGDSIQNKGLALQLNINGSLIWMDTIGLNNVILNDVTEKNDQLLMVGEHYNDLSFRNIFYTKTDLQGGVISNTYSSTSLSRRAFIIDTIANSNSVYISAIYEDPAIGPGYDISMREHSPSFGNLSPNLLGMTYPGDDIPGQILATNDGGAVIVGRTESQFTSYHHVFICKVGPNNDMPNTTVPHNETPLVSLSEEANENIKLYPNPTSNILNISVEFDQLYKVSIISLNGNLLLESNSHKIDVSELNTGVYIVSLETNKGAFKKRLVIR